MSQGMNQKLQLHGLSFLFATNSIHPFMRRKASFSLLGLPPDHDATYHSV
jgi:hypothetical protein